MNCQTDLLPENPAKIIFIGKGNYCGTAEISFNITCEPDKSDTVLLYPSKNNRSNNAYIGSSVNFTQDTSNGVVASIYVTDSYGKIVYDYTCVSWANGIDSLRSFTPEEPGVYNVSYRIEGYNVQMVYRKNHGYIYVYKPTGSGENYKQTITVKKQLAERYGEVTDIVFDGYQPEGADTVYIKAKVNGTDNPEKAELKWSSLNESVAVIDQNGKVTILSPGSTVLTAETVNGVKMELPFDIESIDISQAEIISLYKTDDGYKAEVVYDGQLLEEGKHYNLKVEGSGDVVKVSVEGKGLFNNVISQYINVADKSILKFDDIENTSNINIAALYTDEGKFISASDAVIYENTANSIFSKSDSDRASVKRLFQLDIQYRPVCNYMEII